MQTNNMDYITGENGPFPVLDNVLTSSQIIRLRLKAPGLLVMPCIQESLKRESEDDPLTLQPAKRPRIITDNNGWVTSLF